MTCYFLKAVSIFLVWVLSGSVYGFIPMLLLFCIKEFINLEFVVSVWNFDFISGHI